ncbi:LLM class flavin-dependent oxidoreductase [Nocardia sp. CA-120079]|uniref:LLM class flavin-dependent oxidoreductase n=1 Tax=Nocardia sp. CA-120079 TaxID=3239974 RepID=UPI003D985AA2
MLPAVAMLSVPGRLAETVALGAEFDAAGFPGLYLPSAGDPVSLCLSLAHAPRVALAALGPKMVDLALTRANGLIQANAARSRLPELMAELRDRDRPPGFEVADMIPTVVGADITAARERCRDILLPYLARAGYVAYWRAAGYTEEMDRADAARRDGDNASVRAAMTDRWIDDVCLCGPASRIREGLAAWFETGIDLPILVPSSLDGGHRTALRQLLGIFG